MISGTKAPPQAIPSQAYNITTLLRLRLQIRVKNFRLSFLQAQGDGEQLLRAMRQ
jgi:hypothetical protein